MMRRRPQDGIVDPDSIPTFYSPRPFLRGKESARSYKFRSQGPSFPPYSFPHRQKDGRRRGNRGMMTR